MQPLEILSKLLDDTYNPVSKTGTFSLKHSLHGNVLILKFMTVMHLAAEKSFEPQVQTAKDHARQLIKAKLKRLKSDYKDATDKTLKTTDKGEQDSVEMIESTANSPRKVAYYRINQTITLDV